MRTRLIQRNADGTDDVVYGKGQHSYAINTPQAVGLAAYTRVELYLKEWFLNLSDGTDWRNSVLGFGTTTTRDAIIRARLLGTPNVSSIASYSSSFNAATRVFTWSASLQTAFGPAPVQGNSNL
jgi:hypothetical protein